MKEIKRIKWRNIFVNLKKKVERKKKERKKEIIRIKWRNILCDFEATTVRNHQGLSCIMHSPESCVRNSGQYINSCVHLFLQLCTCL
jgi:hypothetical protein